VPYAGNSAGSVGCAWSKELELLWLELNVKSNGRNATPEQVAKIESFIDASLEGAPLPADEYFEALWHFLTVSEIFHGW